MADGFPDSGADLGVDLFGLPVLPPRGPGRPAHVPTAESRAFVNMMFVCGHRPSAIWQALGIGKTAFYEHYRAENEDRQLASFRFKARQMLRLNTAAEGGNVAAEKALTGMVEREQAKALSSQMIGKAMRAESKEREAKQAPLGKKAQQVADAAQAEGLYGPRKAPSGLTH